MVEYSPPHTSTDEYAATVQQCLDAFAEELRFRYSNSQVMPLREPTLQRFTVMRDEDQFPCFIIVRHYLSLVPPELLEQQRAMLARMRATSSPWLCELLESRAEATAHFLVGAAPGLCPLYQILRHQKALDFGTVASVLEQLAEGLEAATEARWPRMMLDIHALYAANGDVASLYQGLRLAVPPLPAPENGVLSVPMTTTDYIPELAILACELLGMRVQNGRFRPIAELKDRNDILRRVIENGQEAEFSSAREFVMKLCGEAIASRQQRSTTSTATTRTGTGSLPPPTLLPLVPPSLPPPVQGSSAGAGVSSQKLAPAPPQNDEPTRHAPGPASLPRVPVPVVPELLVPPARLRLMARCVTPLPVVSLCIADAISAGRSPKASFVTQFAPATERNKERTMAISREHLQLSTSGPDVCLRDAEGVNHSIINGQAVEGKLRLGRFCRIMIAGVYDLEIRRMDSAWPEGCVWEPSEGRPALPGAAVLAPGGESSVYEHRVVWLFTDAAFGVMPGGALQLQPSSQRDVLGWFLALRGCVWVMAAESDGTVMLDGTLVKANVPQLLRPSQVLKVGTQEWQVEAG